MKLTICLAFILISSQLYGDTQSEIKALHDSSYTLLDSHPDIAMQIGIKTEAMATKAGLRWEEANSIFIQAWIHDEKRETGKAFKSYLRAIDMLRPLSDQEREADLISVLLSNIGILLADHHATRQAHQFLDEGIAIASKHDLPKRLSYLYSNKSRTYDVDDEVQLSYEHMTTALAYARKSDSKETIIGCLNRKGILENHLQQYVEAIETFQSVIKYAHESSLDSFYVGIAWHNIGFALMESEDYLQAEKAYKTSLEIKRSRIDKSEQFITLLDLCELSIITESMEKALFYALRAQEIYPMVEVKPDNYNLFDFLSQIYHAQNDFERSRAYSKRYLEENEKFLQVQKSLLQMKSAYQMELLTDGFFLKKDTGEQENTNLWILWITLLVISLLLIVGLVYQYYVSGSYR